MATGKKYFWLKLDRGFFKRHDIKIVESMPNGKDYVLFYLKLLVESIDHLGDLRFSDEIPYDENMLATITDTNIDIVRSAISVFSKLGLMTLLDDKTIHMKETEKMLGEASSTHRVQAFRERQKQLLLEDGNVNETLHETEKELDIDIDKEIYKEKEEKKRPISTRSTFLKPTIQEIKDYCKSRNNNVNADAFFNFYESKGWMVGKDKMKDWKAAVRTWEQRDNKGGKSGIEIDWLDEYKKENGLK